MGKSVYDMIQEAKKKFNTVKNTYDMFPVGTKVKVITPAQDFNFFYGETGVVTRNENTYLSIVVKFDTPRYFPDFSIQDYFGFQPDDLIVLEKPTVPDVIKELEQRWIELCEG